MQSTASTNRAKGDTCGRHRLRWGMPLDLTPAAILLGVDARTIAAVMAVESSGRGVGPSGPVIRMEVHKLWSWVPVALRPAVDARFRVRGPRAWDGHEWRPNPKEAHFWEPLHRTQMDEHAALNVAKGIDLDAAIRATSYGLGQILGDHWRRCGFASPAEFEAAQATEAGQVDTMARFIAADPMMVQALRAHDWHRFAALYNGGGQVDWYAHRLADAYARVR